MSSRQMLPQGIRYIEDDFVCLIEMWVDENKALRAENEVLKLAQARYEYVRGLSQRAFTELQQDSMRDKGAFDDLVDWRIKNE